MLIGNRHDKALYTFQGYYIDCYDHLPALGCEVNKTYLDSK
jgi:hypothetical protein